MTEQQDQIMSVEEALEKMTDDDRDRLVREICLVWNLRNTGEDWDYTCGEVDTNLTHDEVEDAVKIANQTGARFYVRQGKQRDRLFSSLDFAARVLIKAVLAVAREKAEDDEWLDELITGDDDSSIEDVLTARRVVTWDPIRNPDATEYLFEGRGLELIKRGQQIVEELDLETENWSSEGLCELARADDPEDEKLLRSFRAMLISAHDPALASRNPPESLVLGSALDQFDVGLRALGHEKALKYQRDDGMCKEDAEAQAQDDLYQIEARATELYEHELHHFDYT